MTILYASCVAIFLVSFFPAYLGYQEQHAWVGYIFTIGFALASYIPYLRDHRKTGGIVLVVLILFGYIIESIGILTCFPYGCFAYSEQLGPKLFDIVPRLLAFTRPPLVLGVRHLLHLLDKRGKEWIGPRWKSCLVGGLGLVIVDLILDPIAVMMGLWSFDAGGWWFGIPWTNFAGWMLSGTIGMMILSLTTKTNDKVEKIGDYSYGLYLTMIFFVGYAVWRIVIRHYIA